MQETWVWSLIQADPMCRRAAKPEWHNYWAREPQLLTPACPRACPLRQEKPPHLESSPCLLPQAKKSPRSNEDPTQPNIKIKKLLKGNPMTNKQKEAWDPGSKEPPEVPSCLSFPHRAPS